MKRGYLVSGTDPCWGVPIVARDAKGAKRMAWDSWKDELNCEWIELKVNWKREARVENLPYGVVENEFIAIECGFFNYKVECKVI